MSSGRVPSHTAGKWHSQIQAKEPIRPTLIIHLSGNEQSAELLSCEIISTHQSSSPLLTYYKTAEGLTFSLTHFPALPNMAATFWPLSPSTIAQELIHILQIIQKGELNWRFPGST